jgi:hypothetical protein
MAEHSTVLGGSTAERVLQCPASVSLSKDIPPARESEYAADGTAMHTVMELALLTDVAPSDIVIGDVFNGVTVTADHLYDKLIPAWDATQEAFKRLDVTEFEPEARVKYTPVDDSFGTCDIIAKGRDNLVVVLDYKFGFVPVTPVNNIQLMFYALASMHDPEYADFWTGEPEQPVVLGIIQPANEDVLWTWECTARDLVALDMNLRQSVHLTFEQTDPNMGDWCKWCPAQAVCPAKMNAATATNNLKQSHLNDLGVAMALAADLEPWIKSVKELAHQQLERGDKVEGYKLVNKRSSRRWTDEAEVRKKLSNARGIHKEEYIIETMRSAPQIEKLCKQKDVDFKKFAEYIISSSSGTTMAPESDRREAVDVLRDNSVPDNMKT